MVDDYKMAAGFNLLARNFSSSSKKVEYTDDQKEIIQNSFRKVSDETWEAMLLSLIETQTYLPRTNAFYKAKEAIEEGLGKREKVRAPCNICDGEGLVAAIGYFSRNFPSLPYVRNYRCSCPNGINNWSRKIAFRKDAKDDRIEEWCKQKEITATLAKYRTEPKQNRPLVVSVNEDRHCPASEQARIEQDRERLRQLQGTKETPQGPVGGDLAPRGQGNVEPIM